ncbi:hypothetical protein GHT06_014080 [Daphnia sinensis]|uniref:Uncharacterized protein n=1 Tax=Daphnia sinensis TaxID=1820382 RepID=A0AAD5PYI6_9CRUS|nr:hypothetical protein GHT06_014080 [Daphnia sinensis]
MQSPLSVLQVLVFCQSDGYCKVRHRTKSNISSVVDEYVMRCFEYPRNMDEEYVHTLVFCNPLDWNSRSTTSAIAVSPFSPAQHQDKSYQNRQDVRLDHRQECYTNCHVRVTKTFFFAR